MDNVSESKKSNEVFVKDLLDGVFNLKMYNGTLTKCTDLGTGLRTGPSIAEKCQAEGFYHGKPPPAD